LISFLDEPGGVHRQGAVRSASYSGANFINWTLLLGGLSRPSSGLSIPQSKFSRDWQKHALLFRVKDEKKSKRKFPAFLDSLWETPFAREGFPEKLNYFQVKEGNLNVQADCPRAWGQPRLPPYQVSGAAVQEGRTCQGLPSFLSLRISPEDSSFQFTSLMHCRSRHNPPVKWLHQLALATQPWPPASSTQSNFLFDRTQYNAPDLILATFNLYVAAHVNKTQNQIWSCRGPFYARLPKAIVMVKRPWWLEHTMSLIAHWQSSRYEAALISKFRRRKCIWNRWRFQIMYIQGDFVDWSCETF